VEKGRYLAKVKIDVEGKAGEEKLDK